MVCKKGQEEAESLMKLLLHICCAPDATHPVQILRDEYEIDAFFYNPNIHPEGEYEKRLEDIKRLCGGWSIPLHEGEYDKDLWLELTEEHKDEPEGGKRCEICYRMRLEETAKLAAEEGYDIFGAVLTISPHKDAKKINEIGHELGKKYGVTYLESDFKKHDGFKKSVELSKELGLYRQNYCGCVYSKQK
jgi:predicted adenine nucleotide alpha hydrolase (AANH) superfamily ATPase